MDINTDSDLSFMITGPAHHYKNYDPNIDLHVQVTPVLGLKYIKSYYDIGHV